MQEKGILDKRSRFACLVNQMVYIIPIGVKFGPETLHGKECDMNGLDQA